jgi:hypothetical protein
MQKKKLSPKRKARSKPKAGHILAKQTLKLLRDGFYASDRPDRFLFKDIFQVLQYLDDRLRAR